MREEGFVSLNVKKEVWKKIMQIKLDKGYRNVNDVIVYLISEKEI